MPTIRTLDPEQTGRWSVTTTGATYRFDLQSRRPTVTCETSDGATPRDLRFIIRCVIGEPMTFAAYSTDPDDSTAYLERTGVVTSIRSA